MIFRNYDPGQIVASFNGIEILGFMDGTFILAERSEDGFAKEVGAQGDVTRVRSRDRSGSVTFTLKAESPTNDRLAEVALDDENFGIGVGELFVKDLNGTTLIESAEAWIRKIPNAEYADAATGREWVIDCAALEMSLGGSVV